MFDIVNGTRTRAVFPALLTHQVAKFRRSIARMLRSSLVGFPIAVFAPGTSARGERTHDHFGLVVLGPVDLKLFVAAGGQNSATLREQWAIDALDTVNGDRDLAHRHLEEPDVLIFGQSYLLNEFFVEF